MRDAILLIAELELMKALHEIIARDGVMPSRSTKAIQIGLGAIARERSAREQYRMAAEFVRERLLRADEPLPRSA